MFSRSAFKFNWRDRNVKEVNTDIGRILIVNERWLYAKLVGFPDFVLNFAHKF